MTITNSKELYDALVITEYLGEVSRNYFPKEKYSLVLKEIEEKGAILLFGTDKMCEECREIMQVDEAQMCLASKAAKLKQLQENKELKNDLKSIVRLVK